MRAIIIIPVLALAACTTSADDMRPAWEAYAKQRCFTLSGADHERCVIEQVDRCSDRHRANLDGLFLDTDCTPKP